MLGCETEMYVVNSNRSRQSIQLKVQEAKRVGREGKEKIFKGVWVATRFVISRTRACWFEENVDEATGRQRNLKLPGVVKVLPDPRRDRPPITEMKFFGKISSPPQIIDQPLVVENELFELQLASTGP